MPKDPKSKSPHIKKRTKQQRSPAQRNEEILQTCEELSVWLQYLKQNLQDEIDTAGLTVTDRRQELRIAESFGKNLSIIYRRAQRRSPSPQR